VLQHLRSGEIEVADVPAPLARPGHLLIQSTCTLISAGTERMLVEFGRAGLIAKARSQPDKVRQVLNKIKTDGLMPTLEVVFSRLDEPLPLGYCNVGVVVEVGEGVTGFEVGDRVVSNGPHAEMVCVPRNLCARIAPGIDDDQAAFTVLGAIGLQGIRLLNPTLGESVVVTGLGLIGLMAVQLLLANGCRVLGIDLDPRRLELARKFGAETVDVPGGADPVATALAFSNGRGVDGVLITAATKSNEPMRQAAQMCRKRGRIVSTGNVGMDLERPVLYEKEISVQVSCSYGPGRYDPLYEGAGQDYPYPYVRWTEQRNFQAILDLLESRRLDVSPLVSKRVEQERAEDAYRALTDEKEALGILLTYPQQEPPRETVIQRASGAEQTAAANRAVVGVIGAGNFGKLIAMPNLVKAGARMACVADLNGAAAAHAGKKFSFARTTTDYRTVLEDADINTVVILTRHDAHGPMVLEALAAGKHVFVEKPLCLEPAQLEQIRDTYAQNPRLQCLVGFNRRFSPHARKIKALLGSRTEPVCMSMMVNAGVLPPDMWHHDPKVGGGRILAEGCHWIDLMMFFAGAPLSRVFTARIGESPGVAVRDDKTSVTLYFADGSIGTLHYFGNGHKSYQKETLEVYCDGKVLRLDNFRTLRGYGWSGFGRMKLRRMDKGHEEEYGQFVRAVAQGGPPVIPFDEIDNVMRATFAAVESAHSGEPVDVK
jgi:predicted dehydrogenase/D-arabinose 1-dehydrogenase-like Zn-dependent alcohol dehydrogenase